MPLPFSTLANTLEALEPVTGRTLMINMLADMLKQAEADDIGELLYLSQGQLLPDFIQKEFGMNERLIYRSVAQAYKITNEEVIDRSKQLGDAGLTAQEFAARWQEGSFLPQIENEPITLREVYDALMKITQTIGSGSQEGKVTQLANLFGRLTPLEAKHIARIVVGRLRVGVGDPTLLDALSFAKAGDKSLRPALERAYNLSSDLGLVARTLYGSGVEGLEAIKVRVGNPVRMALAERADSAEEILTRLGECAVEPKFDGFRLQIHKDGEKVSIYSRGLEDLSGIFPDVVEALHKQMPAENFIIEGEVLAYDPESGVFQPFQVTSQRRRVHNIEEMRESLPLRLLAFDMLLINGKDLTQSPYTERRAELEAAIAPREGKGGIEPSPKIITNDPEQIVNFYEDSLVDGLEGIMAKRLTGTYDAGKRGFNWIKMKRSYNKQLSDTVDCVIVGYDYGKGKRASWGLGSLLVSVYDKATDTFPTVTRVASGFSEQEWQALGKRLEADRLEHRDPRVINVISPDVWVTPRYVLELQADEVSRSQMHPAGRSDDGPGYALRFPRILKEREKQPEDATSVEEIIELNRMQGKGDTRGKRKAAAAEQSESQA